MIKAFKTFIKEKTKDKKNLHIGIIYTVYSIIVFGTAFSNIYFPYKLAIILLSLVIMLVVFVPFISWYKVYYKDDNR